MIFFRFLREFCTDFLESLQMPFAIQILRAKKPPKIRKIILKVKPLAIYYNSRISLMRL